MPNIFDVAADAGVSIKTVSRVLNNEPHVRPLMRERVLASVSKLGYRPNLAARQLAANRSFLISLIVQEATASYFVNMVIAAASECRRLGLHLISETITPEEDADEILNRITANLRPDGIILPAPLSDDQALIASIEKRGIPLVRLASAAAGWGHVVVVDEYPVSIQLMEHLLDQGHRRIALIAPPLGHDAAQARLRAYRDTMAAAGLAVERCMIAQGDFSFASGVRAAEQLLDQPVRPSAIFAANDGMALGALTTATKMGLAVPQDVAIAGFDDSPAGRMVCPQLTTISQPLDTMARAAVLSLIGRSEEAAPLRHHLLIRGSTSLSADPIYGDLDA